MKIRITGPRAESPKAWTETDNPPLVMAVVKNTVTKVSRIISSLAKLFPIFDIGPKWKYAVRASQGRREAVSTGSQAQYPPHPRTSYAHTPPIAIPIVSSSQAAWRESLRASPASSPVFIFASVNANARITKT